MEGGTCRQQVGQDSRQAAFPAELLIVNRGYCVARIPAGLTIPSGLGFTNLMTKDGMLESVWRKAFDNICLFSAGNCLQVTWPCLFSAAWLLYYLFLEWVWSLGRWGGALGKVGEGREANSS